MISYGDTVQKYYPLTIHMTVEVEALLQSNEAKSYLKEIDKWSRKLQRFIQQNAQSKEVLVEGPHRAGGNVSRHKMLHAAFDELLACYLTENPGALPSQIDFLEFMQWSNAMTKEATCEKTHTD